MTRDEWREKNPLKIAITQRGMTVADAATAVGVSSQSIYLWTIGASMPGVENAEKIRKIFGVTYSDLKEWRGQAPEA
jgi:transcriptional regulator with XRE-family HTH domain